MISKGFSSNHPFELTNYFFILNEDKVNPVDFKKVSEKIELNNISKNLSPEEKRRKFLGLCRS